MKRKEKKSKTANIDTSDIVNIIMTGIKYAIYVAMKLSEAQKLTINSC